MSKILCPLDLLPSKKGTEHLAEELNNDFSKLWSLFSEKTFEALNE